MTTHQLIGAGPAGDAQPRTAHPGAVKALGAAAAALVALGAFAAAAVDTTSGAAARGATAPPAANTVAKHHAPLGNAEVRGSQAARAVGEAIRQGGNGYWATYPNGTVVANSPAPVLGDMAGQNLAKPVVGMSETSDDNGYWLVASDGGIFAFNAPFFGSTGSLTLAKPIVTIAPVG